jgi:transcriptional regulator with XRE-family HTH domain
LKSGPRDRYSIARGALADFLRRRREALSPALVGLPAGQRRRTPGLRRDEVAHLANMSENYYERLEQGRGPQPSAAILASLSEALRLDLDERCYLYRLAGHVEPTAPPSDDAVDPGLLSLMRTVAGVAPAFVTDDLATVIAQNDLDLALFGDFTGLTGWGGNLVWRWFTSPAWRSFLAQSHAAHEQMSHAYVADLRATVARRNYDVAALTLVADLRAASGEFRDMWDEHRVGAPRCPTLTLWNERVGHLQLDCVVATSPHSRQRLMTLEPVPGTPTRQRLTELAEIMHQGTPLVR